MRDLSRFGRAMIAATMLFASGWSSLPVLAKPAPTASDSPYRPTVPTRDLDPAALEVIRRFSHWPGSYLDAHRTLLRLGWQPDPKVDCLRDEVGGDDPHRECRDNPGLDVCKICRALPEIEVCSQGPYEHCDANFVHPGSQVVLRVTTMGDMGPPFDNTGVNGFTFLTESSPER